MPLLDVLKGVNEIVGQVNPIGTSISGVTNFVSDLVNNQYMKEMQQKAWSREDNAVQRRVADLKAAGLSPVLAAGSAASTSNPIQVSAPHLQGDTGQALAMAKNLMLADAQIDQTKAQELYTRWQSDNAKKQGKILDQEAMAAQEFTWAMKKAEVDKLTQDIKQKEIDNAERAWNLDFYMRHSMPTNASGITKDAAGISEWLSEIGSFITGKGGVVDSAAGKVVKKAGGR